MAFVPPRRVSLDLTLTLVGREIQPKSISQSIAHVCVNGMQKDIGLVCPPPHTLWSCHAFVYWSRVKVFSPELGTEDVTKGTLDFNGVVV